MKIIFCALFLISSSGIAFEFPEWPEIYNPDAEKDIIGFVIKMANCPDCGMTPFGRLAFMPCGSGDYGKCCFSGFVEGHYIEGTEEALSNYRFNGDNVTETSLGDCDYFGFGPFDSEIHKVKLYHWGTDGGKFESVGVFTRYWREDLNEYFLCDLPDRFISGNMMIEATNCRQENWPDWIPYPDKLDKFGGKDRKRQQKRDKRRPRKVKIH